MNVKQCHLVGFSPCGSTFNVLRAIGAGFPGIVREYSLTLPGERAARYEFGPEDLVILGFPVYGGRLPRIAPEFFAALKASATPALLVGVYGNRDYEDALLEMQKMAEEKGFVPFAAAAVIAEHVFQPAAGAGRPDKEDKAGLEAFGRAAVKMLEGIASADAVTFTAPGQFPYRKEPQKLPFAPETFDNCIECGVCIEVCPAGAIPENDPHTTILDKCLACVACIRNCPVEARAITAPQLEKVAQMLLDKCSARKDSEFFPNGIV